MWLMHVVWNNPQSTRHFSLQSQGPNYILSFPHTNAANAVLMSYRGPRKKRNEGKR